MLSRTRGDDDPAGDGSRRSTALSRPAVRRSFPPAAAHQGRRLVGRNRARPRRLAPARRRRHRVAVGSLGPDQGHPGRLHHRGARLPDCPDVLRRTLVLRHPARGLSRPGRALADRDRVCGRGGDEQLPAREHRHVRDAAHVRRHHPRRDLRGLDRRLPGAEDLLHDRGHLRLPVPLPVRAGLVQREPRESLGQPGRLDHDRGGSRRADRAPRSHLLATGQEALASGQAGRRDPLASEGVPHERVSSVAPLMVVQADRDRNLPGRIRDPGHVRVGHVGDRLGLAGEHRLVHAGGGRDHPGDECARARHVLRCRQ